MILTKLKLLLISAGFFLGMTTSMVAQERLEYRGPLQVQNYTGNALYNYKVKGKDTLLDGPFQLKSSSLEALLEKEDISFLFKGSFKEGVANGLWRFQLGEFQSDKQSDIIDFEYRVLISGRQEEGSGMLKNGKPHGKWIYEVSQIKSSTKEKTLFKSDITYDNGVPQQNFQIENQDAILVGRFLRNGLAHDEWTSYNPQTVENTESWFFEEGVLRKIKQIDDDGNENYISVFDLKNANYETVDLDDNFIEMVRISLDANHIQKTLTNGLPSVLEANANYYNKIDSMLSTLGTSHFKPNFKVRVPSFPLDATELAAIKKMVSEYETADEISKSLLNNSHLNILKRSDKNTLYYYNCVAKIKEEYLDPVKGFVRLGEKEQLQFIHRDKYISKLFSNSRPSKKISVVVDSTGTEKIFELPNPSDFNFEGNEITSIQQLTSYARQSLETIKEALSDELIGAEQAKELLGIEEQLIRQNEALIVHIDSVKEDLPKDYVKALQNIKTFADASLSKYALIKDSKEKYKYGRTLKECFNGLSGLSRAIREIPMQVQEIDSLYQDSVWNPFMAVVMDEEVKKRITSAYKKVLIPYFLKTASEDINCQNVAGLENEIQQTYQRMLILRDEDTKKLERKLRRKKDIQTIMQLLNVQPLKADK